MVHLLQGGGEGDGGGTLAVRSHDLHRRANGCSGAHRLEEGFDPLEAERDVLRRSNSAQTWA